MSILRKIRAAVSSNKEKPPKVQPGEKTIPFYLGTARGRPLGNSAVNTTNIRRDIFSRNAGSINEVIKNLVLSSPDLSHAVATKLAMIISSRYTVLARDSVGRIDLAGTEMIQGFCQQLNTVSPDYTKFRRATDLRSVSSSLLFDLLRYGEMGSELVLNKLRLPAFVKPFSIQNIKWADDTPSTYPIFRTKEGEIPLNFATIFISTSTWDTTSAYAISPLQTAIQASLYDIEFTDDLRRAAGKQLLQRLVVTIDSAKFQATLPAEAQTDTKKRDTYIASKLAEIESSLEDLDPEDALVMFDTMKTDTLGDANRSDDRTVKVLADIVSGQITAGSKTLPSIIGRGTGGSDASSTEAMLFVKSLTDIQNELNIFYSRMFTLAARLAGHQVSIEFRYEEPSLRPDIENESFKSVKQARTYQQLSLGQITDEEASIILTGTLPPDGYVNRSGTMFAVSSVSTEQNSYSNTSATASAKPDATQSEKNSEGS